MRLPIQCAAIVAASLALGGGLPAFDHSDYDRLLREVVRDERVDYAAIKDDRLTALGAYLERIAAAKPEALDRDERLALYLNLYNATVLRAVARRYEPGYTVERESFSVFDEPLVHVSGTTISLNRLEHEIIRKKFDEPRIHVALVCAARSCPPLSPQAFRADTLDAVLERTMRHFVNDEERNGIDHTNRRLELSRIFDWYGEDFGASPADVASYVDRYVDADVAGYDVRFRDYSWELNIAEGSER